MLGNNNVNMRNKNVTRNDASDRSLNSSFENATSSTSSESKKTPHGRGRGRKSLNNTELVKPGDSSSEMRESRSKREVVMPVKFKDYDFT